MKQTKKGSFNEQVFKTIVKYLLAVALVWPFAGWATGIEYTASQNFAVVFIYSVERLCWIHISQVREQHDSR